MCGPCPPGYSGNGETCTYIGQCRINNGGCYPLATCVESVESTNVQCRCPAGLVGDGMGPNGCSISTIIHPCASNPCVHGHCVTHGINFSCDCEPGFMGVTCAIVYNPCVPNPCKNSGGCTRTLDNKYVCHCTAAFRGQRCETSKSRCGSYITDLAGTLSYPPDGSGSDPNIRSCAFVFMTNHTMVLNITFTRFNFADTPTCRENFLQVNIFQIVEIH